MNDSILEQTTAIQADFFEKNDELLQQLATHGQNPQALFIGCADSRVMPEKLLGAKPGDFFMLRNIANIIPPYIQTEIATASLLEFAVLNLKVPHIILCGHTDCGGIRGLDQQIDMITHPALSRWLDLARPALNQINNQDETLSPHQRHVAIVERNVVLQLNNLISYPYIRQRLEADQLELHGWVYDLHQQHIRYYDPTTDQFIVANWSKK